MAVYDSLEKCDIDNQGSVSLALTEVASGQNVPYKQVMALVRIAVTGVKVHNYVTENVSSKYFIAIIAKMFDILMFF